MNNDIKNNDIKNNNFENTVALDAKTRKSSVPWMIVSGVLLLALLYMVFLFPTSTTKAIATVNGEKISKQQLYDLMVKTGGDSALQQLITTALIEQQAKKANITVTDQDVQDEINHIKKTFPSEEQFNQVLSQQGLTLAGLQDQMHTQVMINKLLEPNIQITEQQMKTYFDQNKDTLGTAAKVRASDILLKTKEDAAAVLQQLKSGADFNQLAKDKSQDANTKNKGGDLGYIASGTLDPAVETAAFKLKNGELSDVVQAADGFHVIKVTDRQPAVPAVYDANTKSEIHYQLLSQEINNQFQPWLDKLKASSEILTNLPGTLTAAPNAATSSAPAADSSTAPAATSTAAPTPAPAS